MKSALSQKIEKTQPNYLVPVGFFMFFYAAALSLAEGIRTHASVISFQLEYFIPFLGWLVGVLLTQRTMRAHLPNRDPWIFPLVAALSGWGILMIWRLSPLLGLKQLLWFLFGLLLVIVGFHIKNLIPTLRNYKYLWLFGGLLLIGLTFVAGVNPTGSGPKLWLEVFGFYIQPSEPLKLLMVIFLSAFFADQLRPNVPLMASILPTLLVTGLAGLLLIGQRDLGTAALFVCIYALMLTITTRRRRFLWLIPLLALVAGLVGYFAFDVVRSRVDIWLNPWLNADGAGYQLIQARIAVAAGGLGVADLGDRSASGNVRYEASVADLRYLRIEERADDEVGSLLNVERRCRSVDHRSRAENHPGKLVVGVFYQSAEDLMREIASVRELEHADPAVVAGLQYGLGCLKVFIVEHRHKPRLKGCGDHLNLVVSCHIRK